MDVVLIHIATYLDNETLISFLEVYPEIFKTVLGRKPLIMLDIFRKPFDTLSLAVDDLAFRQRLKPLLDRPIFIGKGNFKVVIGLLDLSDEHYPFGKKIMFDIDMKKYRYRLMLKPFLHRLYNAIDNGLYKGLYYGKIPQDNFTAAIERGREKFYFSLSEGCFNSKDMVLDIDIID